jgi:cell division septum initiation protein DivIVA
MSIREREPPDFSHALRGYDRAQVDEYLASFREYTIQVEDRARAAETALAQCRRELVAAPGTVGISQRLAAILQLANEEAEEIRARARADSNALTEQAASHAARTVDDANQHRDAIQREIDELSVVREELLQKLIELGGRIVEATERYQGYAPGMAPRAHAEVELFDGETVDDDLSVEAGPGIDLATDPDEVTQRSTASEEAPEHQ